MGSELRGLPPDWRRETGGGRCLAFGNRATAQRVAGSNCGYPTLSMQCCAFHLQVAQEIGRTLHRHALMIEAQPIEAAQLGAISGSGGPCEFVTQQRLLNERK